LGQGPVFKLWRPRILLHERTCLAFPNEIVLTCGRLDEQPPSCSQPTKHTAKGEFCPITCRENNHFVIAWISVCPVCCYGIREYSSCYFEAAVMVILGWCLHEGRLKGGELLSVQRPHAFMACVYGLIQTVRQTPWIPINDWAG
jgi:hypothetical protein